MASRLRKPQTATLTVYRIADGRRPIFDGTGASLVGGRWNSPGRPVIYAGASYAGAMLERLVHAGTGRIPKNQKVIVINIPGRVSREEWTMEQLPRDWDSNDSIVSRNFGDDWLESQRSAVLMVPSAVAKFEKNVVINPTHRDFRWIVASKPEPVVWDARLFKQKNR
jgi:RES domain-containing protein